MTVGATVPLHAAHGASLPVTTQLAVGALGGLVATLVTTLVMWRQSYGYVPAYVAASVVWGDPPNEVPRSAAHAIHLASGILAGVAFEAANVAVERTRETFGVDVEYAIVGVTSLSEVLVGALLASLLYVGFTRVVFPRYGGNAYETRPGTVTTQWAVSVAVYGLGLVVFVGTLYEVLPL